MSQRKKSSRLAERKSTNRNRRGRRLMGEPLEDRRLMAASQFSDLFADFAKHLVDRLGDHDHAHPDGEAVAARTARHVIGGETFEFTWEPPAPENAAASQGLATSAALSASLSSLSSIPILNSNLGAAATLYLDFNGHYEATWGAYSNLTTPVFDADGDLTTFSDLELAYIQDIWARVSEDFAPFNVNVTTVEPAVLAAGAPANGANGVALRVAMGGSYADWFGSAAGGVGYINSFTSTIPNTVYVFTAGGGIADPRWSAFTASHEAGHGFGLQHQSVFDSAGVKTAEYNPGDRETWHPIMGSASTFWSKDPTNTWHNGTSSLGPTSLQDDMAILAGATNGFGYRTDDHANSMASATALVGSGTNWVGAGIIATTSDVDWFSVDLVEAENLVITVGGLATGTNLDAVVELRDATGTLIASADPAGALDARFVRNLQGRHYIGVRATGAYGYVGQYTVSIEESLPGVTFTRSHDRFTTSEGGRSESITMALESKPSGDVVFHLESSDPTEGVPAASTIVFTPENWYLPQTVSILGVPDGVADGSAPYAISISPAQSIDPDYDGLVAAGAISAVNLDDVAGRVYWIRSDLTDRVALIQRSRLDGRHAETVLDVYAALGPPSVNYYNLSRLAVDPVGGKFYWTDNTARTINRANLDGSGAEVLLTRETTTTGITVDPLGAKIYWTDTTNDKIQRSNLDGTNVEDVVSFNASTPQLDLASGKLYWIDNVTRSIHRANLDGTDIETILVGNEVDLPQALAVDAEGGKIYFNLRQNFATAQLYRANLDGTGLEMILDLASLHEANPVIQQLAVDSVSGRLYWTDSIRQGIYTADLDGGNVALLFEGDTSFRGIAVMPSLPSFIATAASTLSTSESGTSATFQLELNAAPTADVIIPLATSDPSEGVVSQSSLTFTPANWNIPQSVTVTGVNDSFADGDASYQVILGAAQSADPRYASLDPRDISIVNVDNDMATQTFTRTENKAIPDRGTLTSSLAIAPQGRILDLDVEVSISHGWNEDLDVTLIAPDGTRIELFTDVGGSSSNFLGTILDDEAPTSITAGTAPFTGRFRPEGNLTALEGKNLAGTWRLEAKDDARWIAGTLANWSIIARYTSAPQAPSAIVTPTSGLTTTESGAAASFTIVLDAQPTGSVTFPISVSDPSEGSLSASSVTFTPANWNIPKTVTVTGVDDAVVDGPVAYTVLVGASTSADLDFAGIDPEDVSVINLDNDVPPTKFYVVNDASTNHTYEYGSDGSAVENYLLDSGNAAPRGAASTVAGDKTWVVDANRKVYVYDTGGVFLGSWSAGTLPSNATVEGIATNGTDVWIVDARGDRVYRYAGAASRTSGSQNAASSFALNSANRGPKDIVTDGNHLWVVNDNSTDRVFKYTLSGQLVGNWAISGAGSAPTGITLDPASVSDLWIVDSGTDRVYRFAGAASRTSGSASPADWFALAAGNTNPQGIADPPAARAATPTFASALSRAIDSAMDDWRGTVSRSLGRTFGAETGVTARSNPVAGASSLLASTAPTARRNAPATDSLALTSFAEERGDCADGDEQEALAAAFEELGAI